MAYILTWRLLLACLFVKLSSILLTLGTRVILCIILAALFFAKYLADLDLPVDLPACLFLRCGTFFVAILKYTKKLRSNVESGR